MIDQEIRLNKAIFDVDVIARAAHRYTGDFFVSVDVDQQDIVVRLRPKGERVNTDELAERFRNDALDERLREAVRKETGELQATLIRAALREAAPEQPGISP